MTTVSYRSFTGTAAENYERHFVPKIATPVSVALLETAALQPGERVLDVGCGTGVIARLAAEAVGSSGTVTGLDLTPDMIEIARAVVAVDHRMARRRRHVTAVRRRGLRRRALPDGPDVHAGPSHRGRRDAARDRHRWARRRQHPGRHPTAVRAHGAGDRRPHQCRPRRLRPRGVLHARPRRRRIAAARRRSRRRDRRDVDRDAATSVRRPSSCGSTSTSPRWRRSSPRPPQGRRKRWNATWSSRGSRSSGTSRCRSTCRW